MAYDKYEEKKAYHEKVIADTIALVEQTGKITADKKLRGEPIKPVEKLEIKPDLKETILENEKTFNFKSIYAKFWLSHFRKKNTKENFLKMFEKFFEKPDNKEKLKNTYNIIIEECKKIEDIHIKDSNRNWCKAGDIIKYVIKHDTKCGKDFFKQIVERIQADTNRLGLSPESSEDIKKASLGEELKDLEFAFLETVKDLFVKNFKKDI